MPSIYTTDGKLVNVGPDGQPYDDKAAAASAADRNARAAAMGLAVRYEVGPDWKKR